MLYVLFWLMVFLTYAVGQLRMWKMDWLRQLVVFQLIQFFVSIEVNEAKLRNTSLEWR